jgi:hypothetical protein
MIFGEIVERENTITIDGYSKAKTLKGAIKDLAKEVAKYSTNEAEGLTAYIDDTIKILNQRNKECAYWVDCEEVPCATRYINDEEVEYKESNYYIGICFVK